MKQFVEVGTGYRSMALPVERARLRIADADFARDRAHLFYADR
jgi:hypothetical protein